MYNTHDTIVHYSLLWLRFLLHLSVKESYCDHSMSGVSRQQFALNENSYTMGTRLTKLL